MTAQYEDVKKEIRSLLISYQRGASLSEFRREYRKFIGRELPSRDFNYKDDISFLHSMPDVVYISNSPVPGDYHLMAVADKSVQHIQKMVAKQKNSKRNTYSKPPRPPSRSYSRRGFTLPPRFNKKELPPGVDHHVIQLLENFPYGLKMSLFLNTFCERYQREFKFKDWGFSTLEECLEGIPGISAKTRNDTILVHLTKYVLPPDKEKKSSIHAVSNSVDQKYAPLKSTSISHTTNVNNKNGQSDYFDRDFKENAPSENCHSEKKIASSTLSSNFLINRCVEDSYQESLISQNIKYGDPFSNDAAGGFIKKPFSATDGSKADTLDTFPLIDYRVEHKPNKNDSKLNQNNFIYSFNSKERDLINSNSSSPIQDGPIISENIRHNLQKVIQRHPHGIYAVEFPNSYEKVLNTPFDLHSLGFNDLAEFIDAVPDIMVRKPVAGSKKDWVIYPANVAEELLVSDAAPGKCSALFLECVIVNTRRILEAYSEGIKLSEFLQIYSFNCREVLHLRDLGFDNIENFLLSIAARVPLRIVSEIDCKIVHIDQFNQDAEVAIKPPVFSLPLKRTVLDIVSSDAIFEELKLPSDFNYDEYVPVYIAHVNNPALLYVQLVGEEYSKALDCLYNKITSFYYGESSDLYKMEPRDIKVGKICIALWPGDELWYRAVITSVIQDFVKVLYVDYGTTSSIPTNMLRYMRKEYLVLPVQAMKSRLDYLKPPKKQIHWDKTVTKRILELCKDKELMAKVEEVKDGILSLILCDTNGPEDVFLNDILVTEELAEIEREELESPIPAAPQVTPQIQPEAIQQMFSLFLNAMQSSPEISQMMQNMSLNATPNGVATGLAPISNSVAPGFAPIPKTVAPGFSTLTSPVVPNFASQQMTVPATSSMYMPYGPSTVNNFYASPPFNTPLSLVAPNPSQGIFLKNEIEKPRANENKSLLGATGGTSIVETNTQSQSTNGSSSPDDIFSDDDELFDKMCEKFLPTNNSKKQRYVKRVETGDGYVFHVLLYDSKPYVSSGDISNLIWYNKNPFHLLDRLPSQEIEFSSVTLPEVLNKEFFYQLEKYCVKGIQRNSNSAASILMYPLEKVNQILNLFGHPSASLRTKIKTIQSSFNPSENYWQQYSDSEEIKEREDDQNSTDDDKAKTFNRLCLNDLKTMKESLKIKRHRLVKELPALTPEKEAEIARLNELSNKVRERITEIEHICKMFKN